VDAGLSGRPAEDRLPDRGGSGIGSIPDPLERDLELIRGRRQFGTLGDDEAAPVVLELRPAEQGPPSSVGRPGPILKAIGSRCEVRQCQDGQVDAGTAAIITVGLRVDPGRWAQASRQDLAVGDQGQGATRTSLGGLLGVLAEAGDNRAWVRSI
jgi:hypothetical protein